MPVVITEMGHGTSWAQGLMAWVEQQGGAISYMPWTWNTCSGDRRWCEKGAAGNATAAARSGGAGEALVKNYDGEPTDWGKAVKASFEQATVGIPFV